MKLIQMLFTVALLAPLRVAKAASPGNAPSLPITGTRIVNVATETQLQTAMGNLQDGDTLLLADGTYNLTTSLYINGRHNVTIRGNAGSTNVILVGKGMNNANHGGVPFGIWSNGTNTTIAHLTIRDTWDNEIIFNPGAQSPHVYCVRLLNAGSQFIKSNPTDVTAGIGVNNGVVEYCVFEYTGSPPADHGSGVGYFNGISAHAAQNWIIRGNLFKNLHNPDGTAYPWNPAVLFWRHSVNTVTEQNIFINADRAVAYGLDNTTPYLDHAGGVVRNNFIYLAPGLMSASRKASSDGSIIVWNSPGTRIDHNTVLLNSNEFYAVEFRFSTTTNGTARNNLADAPVHLRDSATAAQSGNLLTAVPGMFVNPATADLHLQASATNAIDKAATLGTVTNDFDGDLRPKGASSDIGADEFTTNAPPRITDFRLSGTNCLISFTTFLGVGYDVQRASELTGSAWLHRGKITLSLSVFPRERRMDMKLMTLVLLILLTACAVVAAPLPSFQKQVLTDKYFCDGITAGDLNRDGKMDIVAGPFWYEGPDFKTKHEFYPAKEFPLPPSPTDSMFSYVHDFNGDGWPDILVLGRVHLHQAFWYENPKGAAGLWKKHFVFERVKGESPPFLDADGDGKPEIVAHWEDQWGFIQPDWTEPTRPWTFKPITDKRKWEQFYHGTGLGDVNSDGRLDLLLNEGWYEQPADRNANWIRHEFRFGDKGGAQMFACDVNGDGRNDIITALDAHGWGLAWFEQVNDNGRITFKKHVLMSDRSEESKYGVAFTQPHALALADLDGDGLKDIVVGKRLWAHGPNGDIEPNETPVLYWFQLTRDGNGGATFVPHRIDDKSGVGVQLTAADVNGDGRVDILTVSKLGAFLFLNRSGSDVKKLPSPSSD